MQDATLFYIPQDVVMVSILTNNSKDQHVNCIVFFLYCMVAFGMYGLQLF